MEFSDFKNIISNNIKGDKNELKKFIHTQLKKLPVPTVEVNKNTFIERATIISKDKEVFNLDRLSYIPIELKDKVEEGRFNNNNEPTFYGAFTDMIQPETTRYFLSTELDHSLLNNQSKAFNFTVTKWLSTESFTSIFFLFKEDYCTNELTLNALSSIKQSEEYKNLSNQDIQFLELMSDEFARTDSSNNYNITNIVFNFYKKQNYKSIIYPGVRSKYKGTNIAMLPTVLDNNWTCCFGSEFSLIQKGNNISINAKYKINLKGKKLIYSTYGKSEIGDSTIIDR